MAERERWYFTKEELEDSPSRKCGITADKELYYRQQAANLIQELGQKLKVQQLVINTAIVYMHRFYTLHSFSHFHRNAISSCALFLAAKVEEQHRKLEHVIKVSQLCLGRDNCDVKSEQFQQLAAELVHHENLMLRTLGFDLRVHHPHTWVVNYFDLIRGKKDLAQASYIMATNSLHLTTMCLQYKPAAVACICIYFVFKWAGFELPRSSEGKNWWSYVDETVTQSMLEKTTNEFLNVLKKCPARLKRLTQPNNPSFRQMVDRSNDSNRLQATTSDKSTSLKYNHVRPLKSIKKGSEQSDSTLIRNKNDDHRQHHHRRDNVLLPKESTSGYQINSLPRESAPVKENNSSTKTSHSNNNINNSATTRSNSSSIVDDKFIKSMEHSYNNNSMPNSNDKMNKSNLSVINSNNNNRLSCNINNSNDNLLFPDSQMFSDSDYSDSSAKKDIPDFKMEFSDNEDSNISDYNLGLSSTFIMNDNSNSGINNQQNLMSANSFTDFSQQLNQNNINNNNKINPIANNNEKYSQQTTATTSSSLPLFNEFPSNSNHLIDFIKKTDSPSETSNEKSNLIHSSSLALKKQKPTFVGNKHHDLNMKQEQPDVSVSNTQNQSSLSNNYPDSQIPFNLLGGESTSTKLLAPTNPLASSSSSLHPLLPPHNVLPSQIIPRNNLLTTSSSSILGGVHHQDQSAAAAAAFNQLVNDTSTTRMRMMNNILNNSLDETSNHSRTSSHLHKRHKEKHKHKDKHKQKHKEKHKHKHKSKDKDKHNRHQSEQEAELSSQSQPSFSLVTPEDQSKNQQRIKLKIVKNNLITSNNEITDSSDKLSSNKIKLSSPRPIESSQTEEAPLKFKINLKKQNISTTPPSSSSFQPKKKSRKH